MCASLKLCFLIISRPSPAKGGGTTYPAGSPSVSRSAGNRPGFRFLCYAVYKPGGYPEKFPLCAGQLLFYCAGQPRALVADVEAEDPAPVFVISRGYGDGPRCRESDGSALFPPCPEGPRQGLGPDAQVTRHHPRQWPCPGDGDTPEHRASVRTAPFPAG
jgi:hypothetical protein